MSKVIFQKQRWKLDEYDSDGNPITSEQRREALRSEFERREEQLALERAKPWYLRYSKIIFSFVGIIVTIGVGMIIFTQVEDLSTIGSLYFTVVTITTVGFGDITPGKDGGQTAVIFYGFLGLVWIGYVLSMLSDAAQKKVQHLMEKVAFPESSSDPYVVIMAPVQPCKCIKGCERYSHKSPHVEKNLNPTWEGITWEVSLGGPLGSNNVRLLVLDWDNMNYDDIIGYVEIDAMRVTDAWQTYSVPIQAEDKTVDPHIQLKMRREDTLLHIELLGCTDLPIMDDYTGLLQQSVNNTKELFTALVILFTVLLSGALAFAFLEDWRYYDSVYFCWSVLTTVGYGDFSPQTDRGRLVFVPYAFLAIGIGGYIIGLIQAGGISAGATSDLPKLDDGSLDFASIYSEINLEAIEQQEERAYSSLSQSLSSSGSVSSAGDGDIVLSRAHAETLAQATENPFEKALLTGKRVRMLRGNKRRGSGRGRQYALVSNPDSVPLVGEYASAYAAVFDRDVVAEEQQEATSSGSYTYASASLDSWSSVEATNNSEESTTDASRVTRWGLRQHRIIGGGAEGNSSSSSSSSSSSNSPSSSGDGHSSEVLVAKDDRMQLLEGQTEDPSTLGDSLVVISSGSGVHSKRAHHAADAKEEEEAKPCIPAKFKPSTYFGNSLKYKFAKQLVITGSMVAIGTLISVINDPSLRWFDGLYFAVVTMTTVGYGDVLPTTDWAKAFVMVWGLAGLASMSGFFSLISESAVESKQPADFLRYQHRLDRARPLLYRFLHSRLFSIIYFCCMLITFICIGAGLFSSLEDHIPWYTGIYMSVVTITTIGYGDFFPLTDEGKFVFLFYIVIGLGQLSHTLFLVQKFTSQLADRQLAELEEIDELERMTLQDDSWLAAFNHTPNYNPEARDKLIERMERHERYHHDH